MNKKLRKIINFYGIEKQLKYFQSEVFELNEAIIKKRNKGAIENMITVISNGLSVILNTKTVDPSRENIKEEIADVMVMLKQFQLYYNISTEEIRGVMKNKIARQLERIEYLERSNNRTEDIIIEQRQEISDLEDNWDELKEYAKEIVSTDNELYGTDLLNKMQEIEKESDNK